MQPIVRPVKTGRRAAFRVVVVLSAFSVSGCVLVPNNGPLTSDVLMASANDGKSEFLERRPVFDTVKVDQEIAQITTNFRPATIQSTFGIGNSSVNPVLGVGDTLAVTIFEAGPDGLFSTAERKASTLDVTIQPNGEAAIPYVGSLRFAGLTLESARSMITQRLASRAVEPDVILNLAKNGSRQVTVLGAVRSSSNVPLGLRGERVLEVIANAGGLTVPPYEAEITLTRDGITRTAYAQQLLDNPKENIFAQPGDQIFVSSAARTFAVLGSTGKTTRIKFETAKVNLIEAASMAGGAVLAITDPDGYFVFRYEEPSVVTAILGADRVAELKREGMVPDGEGRYPIIYQFDLTDPAAYLVGQKFMMRDGDVLYVARHRAADYIRFLQLISQTAGIVRTGQTIESVLQ